MDKNSFTFVRECQHACFNCTHLTTLVFGMGRGRDNLNTLHERVIINNTIGLVTRNLNIRLQD